MSPRPRPALPFFLGCLAALATPGCHRDEVPANTPPGDHAVQAIAASSPAASSPAPGAPPATSSASGAPPAVAHSDAITLPAAWTTCAADADCVIAQVGCCEVAALRAHAGDARAALHLDSSPICPVKSGCVAEDDKLAACRQQRCRLPRDLLSLSSGFGSPPAATSSPVLTTSAAPSPDSPTDMPDPGLAKGGKKQKRATFHCFSWIHVRQASTDCYRTSRECAVEKKSMEDGARPTAPCEKTVGASCTMVSRPDGGPSFERCFSGPHGCQAYRAFVQGNGLTVAACVDR